MDRRDFIKLAGVAGIGIPLLAACEPITRVNFGSLGASGVANLSIPDGFTARRLATTGSVVRRGDGTDTAYTWHPAPDGAGVFPVIVGETMTGWVYTSNSEAFPGGVGALKFDMAGNVVDAYRILDGTLLNCSGGVMPFPSGWKWLSCEEVDHGRAFECDPYGPGNGVERLAMGRFKREAAAADVVHHVIYQTEDRPDGAFYRFTPTVWGDLTAGVLEVMTDAGGGAVGWAVVPDPDGDPVPTRNQDVGPAPVKRFNGGEGVFYQEGNVYVTTKGDNRLWRYVPDTNVLTVVYDDTAPFPTPRHLSGVDAIVATTTNRVFVAEDGGNMEIVGVDVSTGATYPIIRYDVTGSEITGPAFSPDGKRLYFSSQRNPGETFEVHGPWNHNAPPAS